MSKLRLRSIAAIAFRKESMRQARRELLGSGGSRTSVRRRRGPAAGFSLIEVLAALLVTMLLVVTLTPFAEQMLATWARGAEVANIVEIRTRGLGRLREDLRHAVVWTGYGPTRDWPAFAGDETSMSFPAVTGYGSSGIGIEYLSFMIWNAAKGRALVRLRAPVIGSTYGNFVDRVVLLSGPFRYRFRYYSRDGTEVRVWSKARLNIPARIEFTIADANGRIFRAPISIPTFASISAACFARGGLRGCPSVAMPVVDDAVLKTLNISLPNAAK